MFTEFTFANLNRVELINADLYKANLGSATLRGANLDSAMLREADLSKADLSRATLREANLSRAKLTETKLVGADLSGAICVGSDMRNAILTNCRVYGISVWDVRLEGATQRDLAITRREGIRNLTITVDNLKVAQFIYLILKNQEIRDVIDTITTKVVLILGRFTPERKAVLDALRDELRKRNYSPVIFDFVGSKNRDITETISLLARMARFVLADLTDAKSVPQELSVIVPDLPSVPVQPLLQGSASEYSMFKHFARYPWVLPIHSYTDQTHLLATLKEQVIDPVEQKAQELAQR